VELYTSWRSWPQAEAWLRERLPDHAVRKVGRAAAFAAGQHGDQRRPTGAPYTEHLLETLEVLARGAGVTDPDLLCAAVLHDVVEDTAGTLAQVAAGFGARVAELVGWVTIPPPAPGQDKAAAKAAYLRGLRHAPRDAILVKLADRASNVQTLRNLAPARQRAYYAQTVEHIVPLADGDPWFRYWYASWRAEFADLAAPGPLGPGGPGSPSGAAAGSPPIRDISSHANRPTGYTK
jgi:guanosine-3',5'-bis(diphosphate) 3'-pyrophosphohydrolase